MTCKSPTLFKNSSNWLQRNMDVITIPFYWTDVFGLLAIVVYLMKPRISQVLIKKKRHHHNCMAILEPDTLKVSGKWIKFHAYCIPHEHKVSLHSPFLQHYLYFLCFTEFWRCRKRFQDHIRQRKSNIHHKFVPSGFSSILQRKNKG